MTSRCSSTTRSATRHVPGSGRAESIYIYIYPSLLNTGIARAYIHPPGHPGPSFRHRAAPSRPFLFLYTFIHPLLINNATRCLIVAGWRVSIYIPISTSPSTHPSTLDNSSIEGPHTPWPSRAVFRRHGLPSPFYIHRHYPIRVLRGLYIHPPRPSRAVFRRCSPPSPYAY